MKITLVSPFRVLLNIDTDLAYARADRFYDCLKVAAKKAGKVGNAVYDSQKEPPAERPFTKYTHLDQDYGTWFTTPVVKAALNPAFVKEMEQAAEKRLTRALAETQRPTEARIDIYDNTLAVMTLELEFEEKALTGVFTQPSDLEIYLSEYAAACTRYVQDYVVQPFIEALAGALEGAEDWRRAPKVLRRPKEFLAFNDLDDHDFPAWNHRDEPSLWTHRIFHLYELSAAAKKKAAKLLRQSEFEPGAAFHIGQGSSYILAPKVESFVVHMNATSQYFYCMVDALNHSQKRLARQLAAPGKKLNLSDAYARFDRTENLLSEMENELLDFTTGLQGISRDIFDDIQSTFRTRDLVAAMEQRSELLRNKLERASRRRSLLQQKLLSFILLLVGSIQVVSLVIQVFGYTGSVQEDDQVLGLTDIVQRIPFDLAMSIVILMLILIALYWSFRKDRR